MSESKRFVVTIKNMSIILPDRLIVPYVFKDSYIYENTIYNGSLTIVTANIKYN